MTNAPGVLPHFSGIWSELAAFGPEHWILLGVIHHFLSEWSKFSEPFAEEVGCTNHESSSLAVFMPSWDMSRVPVRFIPCVTFIEYVYHLPIVRLTSFVPLKMDVEVPSPISTYPVTRPFFNPALYAGRRLV